MALAEVDLVEAESAAGDVADRAVQRHLLEMVLRGARRTAVEYIRATEEMLRRSRDIIEASMRWDCLLMPTVTLPLQPLDTILADTEPVAEDDLAYIRSPIPSTSGQPAISLPLGWTMTACRWVSDLSGTPMARRRPWRSPRRSKGQHHGRPCIRPR